MSGERVSRLVRQIWPPDFPLSPTQVFAIFDGAADPRIYGMVRASTLDVRCLYAGKVEGELAEVAPYLVHVHAHATFTRRVFAEGWGRSWGIWFHAAVDIDALRRHFRHFLRMRDPRGRPLLFRYYDPRVLDAYLATATAEERAAFFGPVTRFLVEASDGGVRTHVGDGSPSTQRAPRPIREAQLEALAIERRARWVRELLAIVRRVLARHVAARGDDELMPAIVRAVERSEAYGIVDPRDVCRFVCAMVLLGERFDSDPQLPWIATLLASPEAPRKRMRLLFAGLRGYARKST